MEYRESISFIFSVMLAAISSCMAIDCVTPVKTITVDQSGKGNFKTIQSAIDSVPSQNSQWVHIQISQGRYWEKVIIPQEKPCIILEGVNRHMTSISWSDYEIQNSATFLSSAENIVAKSINFENTYNIPVFKPMNLMQRATAVTVFGDKTAFFDCGFLGVQDTLWDQNGRHYFHNCYIQGGVDFIFGNGQSLYEKCVVNNSMGTTGLKIVSFITAQGRESPKDPSGFVFNNCVVKGDGKTNLGRAWRAYSRVIFANSELTNVVTPEGWSAWGFAGHEANITYVEEGNYGPGADKSKRVPWLKNLQKKELRYFLSKSFINQDGWIQKIPVVMKIEKLKDVFTYMQLKVNILRKADY